MKFSVKKIVKNKFIIIPIALVVLLLVIITTALSCKPTGLVSAEVDDPNQISPYLTHYLGPKFYDSIQLGKPFDIEISQDGLNDILIRDSLIEGGWPVTLSGIDIYAPSVQMTEQDIKIIYLITFSGINTYISLTATPKILDDGNILIKLSDITAGAVKISSFISLLAQTLVNTYIPESDDLNSEQKMIRAIVAGKPFEPYFKANSSTVKVSKITLKNKSVTIGFIPR